MTTTASEKWNEDFEDAIHSRPPGFKYQKLQRSEDWVHGFLRGRGWPEMDVGEVIRARIMEEK